ncbi:MAG: outer membrane protein transport protein [Deltaproteobacteria bacterium]|nr:outer membrane protein transport protein [Deltaproteobacteria bacterium]
MTGIARIIFIIAIVLSTLPGALAANELTNYGFTSRSTAMAEAVTADVKDVSALYYNPAGLAEAQTEASANLGLTINLLQIQLWERDDAFDISQDAYDGTPVAPVDASFFPPVATTQNANKRDNTKYNELSTSLILGLTLDPGSETIRFGLAVFIPLQKTNSTTYYPDSREQHFSNSLTFSTLGQKAPGPIFMMGTGIKLARWLKFGATMLMYRRNTTHYNALLASPATDAYSALNVVKKESQITPGFNLGLEIDPHEKFGIGLSYRHRMYTGQTLVSAIETYDYTSETPPPGDARFQADTGFVTDYNPSDLTLGVRFGNHCPWVFNIDATWRMWRWYKATGDGTENDEFHDVVIPKLSFEYEINGRLDLRLGTAYLVNPVYTQDAETNFVDNDRVKLSLGLGIDIPWPPNAQLDFHAQLQFLVPEENAKRTTNMNDEFPESVNVDTGELLGDSRIQTNNPGFPGYESRGIIITMGTALSVPF